MQYTYAAIFDVPEKTVEVDLPHPSAKRLGVSHSVLKKTCKQFGVMKWPRRFPEDIMSDSRLQQKSCLGYDV